MSNVNVIAFNYNFHILKTVFMKARNPDGGCLKVMAIPMLVLYMVDTTLYRTHRLYKVLYSFPYLPELINSFQIQGFRGFYRRGMTAPEMGPKCY